MSSSRPDPAIVARLFAKSQAARWGVGVERFAEAAAAGLALVADPDTLHVEDLALAIACADGVEAAWEHFVTTHRATLYRAADAIDRTGAARESAEALYGELFGVREKDGVRQSLFRYFHGRSKLDTWLRAILAQRHIDRLRASRKTDPLPEDDDPMVLIAAREKTEPGADRSGAALRQSLTRAIAELDPRDRLRLRLYYTQQLKLAAIGKMLGEHEGTVSRHLTRTRGELRSAVTGLLRESFGFDDRAINEIFVRVSEDPGPLDLGKIGLEARSNE